MPSSSSNPLTPSLGAAGTSPRGLRFVWNTGRRTLFGLWRRLSSLITLRTRLLWILVLAFAPAFALIVRDHAERERAAAHRIAQEALRTAGLAAEGYARTLEGTRHVLVAFTQLPDLRGNDPKPANKILRAFLARYPNFMNIGVIHPTGRVFASALPFDPKLDLSHRHYFKEAMEKNDFAVGRYQIEKITRQASVNCGFPIRNAAGRPARVVFAALNLAWMNRLASGIPIPDESRLLLLDRDGAVLAAAPAEAATPGTTIPSFDALISSQAPPLTNAGRVTEDRERLYAVVPIRNPLGSGFHTIFEISRRSAYRESNLRLYINLGLLIFSAFLVLVLGRAAGDIFITRHVTALLNATRRLAQGDRSARTGITDGPGEIGELAGAVDQLAVSLEKRDEELREIHGDLERQVTERTRELKSTNEQLEAFSFSVSHDLRAPLRAIDGFSQILLNEHALGLTPEGKRLLGVVVKNTQMMSALIEDLLTFSRLGRQEPCATVVEMGALVHEVYQEILASENRRAVQFSVNELPVARGDAAMVRQIWANLLQNALKFTSQRANTFIEVSADAGEVQNTYWVKDNGVGFEPKHAHRLFHVFQRLHSSSEFEGTGVGLAIVQRIVQKHGGRVWAKSVPGEGAVFYFSLPRAETRP